MLRSETPIVESKPLSLAVESRPLSIPLELEAAMITRTTSLPPRETSQMKRVFEEEDEAVITTIDLTDNSRGIKRIRVQPERIPDGTIIQGNISHSAFAIDPVDDGPSSFGHLMDTS